MGQVRKKGFSGLSVVLAILLVFSLLPGFSSLFATTAYADDPTTDDPATEESTSNDSVTDDFGITMQDWTAEEETQAKASVPFGTYGAKTTLFARSELYISAGWDKSTRYYGKYDWNNGDDDLDTVIDAVEDYTVSEMSSVAASYTFAATAAMDLYNTGKDEYIATLAFSGSGSSSKLQLFVTDTSNNYVATAITVYSGEEIEQLADVESYNSVGAIAVAAGDFDGDGYDTIIVYVPSVDDDTNPYIAEYTVKNGELKEVGNVHSNVLSLLDVTSMRDLYEHDLQNQPMVSLVAEDTDKDGIDELVITAGMNDVQTDNQPSDTENNVGNLGSQLFIYDYMGTDYEGSNSGGWYQSFHTVLATDANTSASESGRLVWASATVGNIVASTNNSGVDYPEILAAGYIDNGVLADGWHINVGSSVDDPYGGSTLGLGTVLVQASGVNATHNIVNSSDITVQNTICSYAVTNRSTLPANNFTARWYNYDANPLLSVVAFADQGLGAAESVFISGSVYRYDEDSSELEEEYTPTYFGVQDHGAGSSALTVTVVQAAVAGNFDGNDEGREQIICSTNLKQSGKNNAYSRLYLIYNEGESNWDYVESDSYIANKKGSFYLTLNAVDTDDDSVIATLTDVQLDWSEPDVLAILEASPYFEELDDGDIGNSATTYGTGSSTGEGSGTSFSYSAGVVVGYEAEVANIGAGFEITIANSYNEEFAESTKVSWTIEYSNDTGDNLVVVYRTPVYSYRYVTDDNEEIIVGKTGGLVTSMISVDTYNEAAGDYGLEEITEDTASIATPGDPFSYRDNTASLSGLIEKVKTETEDEGVEVSVSPDGWVQYSSSGTITQELELETETESSFSTALDVSYSAWGTVFGVKVGVTASNSSGSSTVTLDGSTVTKSGAVTGKQYDNYDFQWKFAAWFTKVNANTIPVLGYLVQNQAAPPSPAQNLTVNGVTQDTIELSWDVGTREADQYYVYRVLETGGYTLIGTVDGSTTEYTVTGLNPDTIYTYVVRGAGYNDSGSLLVSVDSTSVSTRTLSEDALDVEITLVGVGEDGVLSSDGSSASIKAEVFAFNAISISYQWQMRVPGTSTWADLGDGTDHDSIDVISGASAATLTLEDLDSSLDGAALRCVVTVPTSDGTPQLYYSDIASLSVEPRATTTSLSVNDSSSGGVGGTGTIDDPYTGYASYTTSAEGTTSITVFEAATETYGDTEYGIYSLEENGRTIYVGIAYDSDGTASYRAVTESEGEYTIGDALTPGATSWMHDYNGSEVAATLPSGFDGDSTVTEEDSAGVTYVKTYLFSNDSPTTTVYWLSLSDGSYYTRTEAGSSVSYALADPQPDEDADIREVFAGSIDNSTLIVLAADDETHDEAYEIYTMSGGSWTYSDTIWTVTDNALYKADNTTYLSDIANLTQVLEATETSTGTTTITNAGTEVSLNALTYVGEESVDTTITYLITNVSTGVTTTLSGVSGQAVTWSASAAGLYQITARATATNSTLSSSDTVYYYIGAVGDGDPVTEYRLVVQQGGDQVTSIQYNGQPVSLSLESRTSATINDEDVITAASDWEPVSDSVNYAVTFDGLTSTVTNRNNCSIDAAGTYVFVAFDNEGVQLASAYLTVSKIAISVAPTWTEDGTGTSALPSSIDDITIAVTEGELLAQDQGLLTQALEVSSDLYDDNGDLIASKNGAFSVTLEWATDDDGELLRAVETLQSRYEVTRESDVLYNFSNYVNVSFGSGENGGISGYYRDASGSDLTMGTGSGSSVLRDYTLRFMAAPNSGYVVDTWSINGVTVNASTDGVSISSSDRIMEVDLETYIDTLDEETSSLHVLVSFADEGKTIEFGVGGYNGEISAKTSEGRNVTSGQKVSHGATVTFTATPNEGYAVAYWLINNEVYTYSDGSTYREGTLTLEDIAESYDVRVYFVSEESTTIYTSVVNTLGEPEASNVTISVTDGSGSAVATDADGGYTVGEDANLTFTASIENASISSVREWQYSFDGETWSTISGSGSQTVLTMYDLSTYTTDGSYDGKLYIRAVVNSAQTYTLTYKIQEQDKYGRTFDFEGDEDIASLVVTSENGTALASGDSIPAYTSISFRLILDSGYQVVGWDNTDDGGTSTSREASIASLEKDTEVIVIIAEKASTDDDEATGDEDDAEDIGEAGDGEAGDNEGEEDTSDDSGVSELLATDSLSAYMQGWDDGTFAPEQDMSRAEVAQVFYNLLRDKNVEIKSFPDVDEDEWYYEAVGVLGTLGIVEGIDGNFEPDRSITRAEFVTIAMRFAKAVENAECYFSDVEEGAWYYEYVAGAYSYGWVEGYTEDNTFRPDNSITRAEAVCLVNRLLGRSIEEGYVLNVTRTFSDVPTDHWGYDQIMLATNELVYTVASTDE